MGLYIVSIIETLEKQITVIADSDSDAIKKIRKEYIDGKIVLDSDDYVDTEYTVEGRG